MFKKLTTLLVLLMIIFSAMPAYAANYNQTANHNFSVNCSQTTNHNFAASYNQTANHNFVANCIQIDSQKPVIYKSDLVVTKNGGAYEVGFTTIKFPKDFIDARKLPITIHVEVFSAGGVPFIEFTPDVPSFNKDVTICVDAYNGLLYDKTLKKNIKQHIRQQTFKVSHFSRYAFS